MELEGLGRSFALQKSWPGAETGWGTAETPASTWCKLWGHLSLSGSGRDLPVMPPLLCNVVSTVCAGAPCLAPCPSPVTLGQDTAGSVSRHQVAHLSWHKTLCFHLQGTWVHLVALFHFPIKGRTSLWCEHQWPKPRRCFCLQHLFVDLGLLRKEA